MGGVLDGPHGAEGVERIALRPAAADGDAAHDAALAASFIIKTALRDLSVKQSRAPFEAADDFAARALRHVLASCGGRFFMARDGERPVAFGAAFERGAFSHCAGLFVLPEYQGLGLGRRLFDAAATGLPAAGGVLSLTSSAANPVSNGLYARRGVYPQHALLRLSGPIGTERTSSHMAAGPATHPAGRAEAAGDLLAEPLGVACLPELRTIDEVVLEADRTPDHRWFLSQRWHPGWLFRRRGRAVAYAYLGGDGTEGDGSVGPVASLRAGDQEAVLRFVLARLADRGVARAAVTVPGPNLAAQGVLWRAGFAFEGATGLWCGSRPFGRLDRYLSAGDCLM